MNKQEIISGARQLGAQTNAILSGLYELTTAVHALREQREALRIAAIPLMPRIQGATDFGRQAAVQRLQGALDALTRPVLDGFELNVGKDLSDGDIDNAVAALATMI